MGQWPVGLAAELFYLLIGEVVVVVEGALGVLVPVGLWPGLLLADVVGEGLAGGGEDGAEFGCGELGVLGELFGLYRLAVCNAECDVLSSHTDGKEESSSFLVGAAGGSSRRGLFLFELFLGHLFLGHANHLIHLSPGEMRQPFRA